MRGHELKSDETKKRVFFPEKVNDSVLIQLETVLNFVQMFKMQAIQRSISKTLEEFI